MHNGMMIQRRPPVLVTGPALTTIADAVSALARFDAAVAVNRRLTAWYRPVSEASRTLRDERRRLFRDVRAIRDGLRALIHFYARRLCEAGMSADDAAATLKAIVRHARRVRDVQGGDALTATVLTWGWEGYHTAEARLDYKTSFTEVA